MHWVTIGYMHTAAVLAIALGVFFGWIWKRGHVAAPVPAR